MAVTSCHSNLLSHTSSASHSCLFFKSVSVCFPPAALGLQASGVDSVRGQEILTLQASLFQAQLELQAGQRAQQQAARTREDLGRALQRLEEDLQGALQHRRDTERHNLVRRCEHLSQIYLSWWFVALPSCLCFAQDLKLALDKARSSLLEREEQLREAKQEWHLHDKAREATIRELRTSLLNKEQLIEVSNKAAAAPTNTEEHHRSYKRTQFLH